MKRLIYLLIIPFILFSCSDDDSGTPVASAIKVEQPDKDIYIGDEVQLVASHTPTNAPTPVYTWESSNTDIAEVSNQGKLKAIAKGETTITLKATELGLTATLKINVNEEAASIKIEEPDKEIYIGDEYQLKVTHIPPTATTPTYAWESSNTNIVTIDDNGKLKGVGVGEATITVTASELGLSANLKINILPILATSITLSDSELELYPDKVHTLTYKVEPDNVTNTVVTWKSSDLKVAMVVDGRITARSAGEAIITATIDGVSAQCKVTVPKTLFGYKFGVDMEKVNPEVIVSNDLAYSWTSKDYADPVRAFIFKNNQLTSIWSSYDPDGFISLAPNNFLKEVNSLNPTQEIKLEYDSSIGRFANLPAEFDSLTWKNDGYNILIRNGMNPSGNGRGALIIEYTEAE